jgi:tetratricopeptide (TPR) repeat protein
MALAAKPEGCKLSVLIELPVTMLDQRPLVPARLNGKDVQLIVDSGAFFSIISPAAAAELQLPLHSIRGFYIMGVGGKADAKVAKIELGLAGVDLPPKRDFVVGGTEVGSGAKGVLGQNILRIADVEYDLANGVIRLIKPSRECRESDLAYWAKPDQAVQVIDIKSANPEVPFTQGSAQLNGQKIKVMFDTGAGTSILSQRVAEQAGLKPDSAGVTFAGYSMGFGQRRSPSWIARFDEFSLGEEKIKNARLRIGDTGLKVDMLVGADFFLSHRVYVASAQDKLYFTYNGGPVFDLRVHEEQLAPKGDSAAADSTDNPAADSAASRQSAPASADAVAATAPAPQADQKSKPGEPHDAEDYARRRAAYTSRRDYVHAIADLTKACALSPQEPRYFYERAIAYLGNRQSELASADLDKVLALKPDDVPALLWDAQRKLSNQDSEGNLADLAKVDQVVTPQDNVRLRLAFLYGEASQMPQAITQYTTWLTYHGSDARAGNAYAERCRARALSGADLEAAISDCDKSQRLGPNTYGMFDSRGLAYLRLGSYDRAIADYNAALKLNPRYAWSLFGRGVAESRTRKTKAADADITAAEAMQSDIAARFMKLGIAP